MARFTLDQVKVGDVLSYLYNTGAFGYQSCFVKVLKISAKQVFVKFENGNTRWKKIDYFVGDIVYPEMVAELRAEGVRI